MSETVTCPNCCRRVPQTPLCENCGKPLPIQQTGLSEPHTSVLPQVKVPGSQQPVSSAEPVVPVRPAVPLRPVAPVPPGSPIQAVVPPSLVSPVEPVAPQTSSLPALFKQTSISSPQTTTFQPSRESTSRGDVPLKHEPTVEVDELCMQRDGKAGTLNVRILPGSRTCENVAVTISEQSDNLHESGVRWKHVESLDSLNEAWEYYPQLDKYKDADSVAFIISFTYEEAGVKVERKGYWKCLIGGGRDQERNCARQIVLNITNNIQGGHASEIHNSTETKDLLEEALRQSDDDAFRRKLQEIFQSGAHAYKCIKFARVGLDGLPRPLPTGTKTDRLVLDLGSRRLLLFSGRTVTFGRNRGLCDISWRHPDADRIGHDDPANIPYRKISGQQCSFEHRGDQVALIDGVRDARGIVEPSSYGTFFNAVQVEGEKLLVSDGTGRGLITFSDSAATGTLSVCLPNDVCAKCTRAERIWCGGGKRPSLVFKRLDGVPESAVMVWSCFRLEEADPSFEGVKIFRSDGGFAWRRGRRCGWLVPGESIETECGTVYVRHLPSPAEIAKEKNDVRITSETCHS